MITKPIEIGKFGRTHALDGHIRVFSYTAPQDNIFTYTPWYLSQDEGFKPISTNLVRSIKQGFIVAIEGISDPESAQAFVDKTIYIDRNMLPELESGHYWHDLVDKQVVNLSDTTLGLVSALHDSGAHDLLLVKKSNGKSFYIPYVDQYIIRVESDRIIVDWDYED